MYSTTVCFDRISLYIYIFFKILFIDLTEIERAQAGRVAGRGRGRSRLPAEQRAQCGTPSQDPGIMT